MEIIRSQSCGNSPKNQLVENLTIALFTGELQSQLELVTDDVQWNNVGVNSLCGQQALLLELETIRRRVIRKLTIGHAISHGKAGAVQGEIQYETTKEGFCFFYEFANIKGTSVRLITSYQLTL